MTNKYTTVNNPFLSTNPERKFRQWKIDNSDLIKEYKEMTKEELLNILIEMHWQSDVYKKLVEETAAVSKELELLKENINKKKEKELEELKEAKIKSYFQKKQSRKKGTEATKKKAADRKKDASIVISSYLQNSKNLIKQITDQKQEIKQILDSKGIKYSIKIIGGLLSAEKRNMRNS